MAEVKLTDEVLLIKAGGRIGVFHSKQVKTIDALADVLASSTPLAENFKELLRSLSIEDQAKVLGQIESEYAKRHGLQLVNRANIYHLFPESESELEELEKVTKLEKRLRKYKSSDASEVWATRWIASPVAYLLPAERREEWLGDLYEVNREMLHKCYPRWMVGVINIGRTVILIVSAVQVKLSDIVSLGFKRGS